ncbi:MAG: diguanylate cyclase, partial [Pedobacter sp.]
LKEGKENNKQLKGLNFNAVIVSFFEDSKGRIWFGTNKNILGVWDGKSLIKYSSTLTESQYANAYIQEDTKGNIWAYSTKAAFLFIKNNFVLVHDNKFSLSYKTFYPRADKSVYFLSNEGLNIRNGAVSNLVFTIDKELLNNRPGYIYVDEKGLWLGNNSGMYVIGFDGKTTQLLKNTDVSQVIKDRNSNIWFTTNNGIYRLPDEKERVFVLGKESNLGNQAIKSITKDSFGRLWMGLANNSIHILNPKTNGIEKIGIDDQKKYNTIKQLVVDEKNNKVFFASDYGLGYVDENYPKNKNINYLKEVNNSVFVVKNFSLDTTNKLALALSSGVVMINDRIKKFEFSSLRYRENKDYFKERAYR